MIERLIAMGIMVWMYAVVIGCFGYVIGRLVCECRNLMRNRKPRNRKLPHAAILRRHARLLRDGVVGEVTWIEEAK
jgi:hypothetical protein